MLALLLSGGRDGSGARELLSLGTVASSRANSQDPELSEVVDSTGTLATSLASTGHLSAVDALKDLGGVIPQEWQKRNADQHDPHLRHPVHTLAAALHEAKHSPFAALHKAKYGKKGTDTNKPPGKQIPRQTNPTVHAAKKTEEAKKAAQEKARTRMHACVRADAFISARLCMHASAGE